MSLEDKIKSLSLDAKKKVIREYYAADVHRFFKDICWTLDEYETKVDPIKKYPYHWPYTQKIINEVDDPKNKWLLFWKSRQVLLTHTVLCYSLWLALFHSGRKIAIQSKKADDADAHIQRMKVVYDKLPWWKPEALFSYCRIKVPEMTSDVFGIAEGGDQLRQYSFSFIFSDELGFQKEIKESFGAAKPLVNSGARYVAATTPPREKNFAYDCYRNPLFKVIELHYSMRPDRGEDWVVEAKKGVSQEDWDRENELKLVIPGGTRVFSEFSPIRHINSNLVYNKYLPVLRGWDFGYHRPAVCFLQIDFNDRINVLKELVGKDVLVDHFADNVIAFTNLHFPDAVIKDYCDLAGTQVNDKSEKTSIQILNSKGIYPSYRAVTNEEDIFNIIRRKLATTIGDRPSLQFHPSCAVLNDAMSFGLLYGSDGEKIIADGIDEQSQKEKGYFKHIIDGFKYIILCIYTVKGARQDGQQKSSALKTPHGKNATQKNTNDYEWMLK